MKKTFVTVVALIACAALPSAASAEFRSMNLTKSIAKAATVTDTFGEIDCGLQCTQDSGSFEAECDGEGMCIPPTTMLEAATQPGWSVKSWSGCSNSGEGDETCFVTMNTQAPKEVIVTFQDVEVPSVALGAPAHGSRVRGTVAIEATAADNDAVQRVDFFAGGVKIGSDDSAPYAASFDSAALPDGVRTVGAQAVDASGLAGAVAERTVTVDNTKPVVAITGGPAQDAVVGPPATAQFALEAEDATSPISAVECALDAGEFAACDSTTAHTLTALSHGPHTFRVRSRDTAGNVSDVVSRSFSVDVSGPDTVIDSGREDGSSSTATDAAFTFSATEEGSTFACRLYVFGGTAPAFGACAGAEGSHSVSGLAPGTYVFEVQAVDAAGNADDSPARRTFGVDAPPTGGGQTPPPGETGGGTGGGGTGDGGTGSTPPPSADAPGDPVIAPPRIERIVAGVTWEWKRVGKRTRANKLHVGGIPAGATVQLICKARGCPFKRKAFAYERPALQLARALKKKRLMAGGTIEVRIVKPGTVGKVVVFKLRPRALPTYRVLCLAPGARKPAAC